MDIYSVLHSKKKKVGLIYNRFLFYFYFVRKIYYLFSFSKINFDTFNIDYLRTQKKTHIIYVVLFI